MVTGVNDAPPEDKAFPDDLGPDAPSAPVASAPMSVAAVADQQARIGRYVASGEPSRVAGLDAPNAAPRRPLAFDASEGTRLDPLLNKTFDLNYAHAVPALNAN